MDEGTSDLLVVMHEVTAGSGTGNIVTAPQKLSGVGGGGLEVKSDAVIESDTFRNDHLLSGVRGDIDASSGSASATPQSETNGGYYPNTPQSEGGGVSDKSSVSEHHAVSRSVEQSSSGDGLTWDPDYYHNHQPPSYPPKLNPTKEHNVSRRLQEEDLDLQTDSFRWPSKPHSNSDSLSLRELLVGGDESSRALNFSDSYRTLYEVLVNVTVDNSVLPSSHRVTSDQMVLVGETLASLTSSHGAQYPPAVLPGLLPPINSSIAGLFRAITATSSSVSPSSSLFPSPASSIIGGSSVNNGSTVATVATTTANWLAMGKVQIPLYAIIFLLAVIGNSLVILTLVQNKRMRTITNVFLLNLAISDLFLGVLCMPFTLVGTLKRDFVFGEFMCKILPFLQGTYRRVGWGWFVSELN